MSSLRKQGTNYQLALTASWIAACAGMTPVVGRKVEKFYYVYLLASGRNGTLYTGVTNDLVRRLAEHKAHLVRGFTARYGVDQLMWFETHTSIDTAIQREKQIKAWKREWKLALFAETNPRWEDLYPALVKGIWS